MSERQPLETLDIVAALALIGANAAGNPVAFFCTYMAMLYASPMTDWAFRAAPVPANAFALTTPGMALFVVGAVLLAAILVGLKWVFVYRPLHPEKNIRAFALSQGIFLPGYLIGFVFFRLLFHPVEANAFSFIVSFSLILLALGQLVLALIQLLYWRVRAHRRSHLAGPAVADRRDPLF